jgi:hypothetical protein
MARKEALMSRSRKVGIVLLTGIVLCLAVGLPPAPAEESYEDSGSYSTGTRVGAYALTPFYFLGKVLYAGTGAIFGGFAWVLSGGNTATAKAVWEPSLKGDYWITPAHLAGDRPVRFIGKMEESPTLEDSAPTGSNTSEDIKR